MAELYSACMPRAKQKERRGIRESGYARQDTVERLQRSLEFRSEDTRIAFGITNKEKEQRIRDNEQRKRGEKVRKFKVQL